MNRQEPDPSGRMPARGPEPSYVKGADCGAPHDITPGMAGSRQRGAIPTSGVESTSQRILFSRDASNALGTYGSRKRK